jgi:probable phosphomutase (TIGR03848 family)
MATVLLVRHGLTELTGPVLAGRTPGVNLDDRGRAQAERLAARLAAVPLAAIVSSPLERCQQTAAAVAAGREVEVQTDDRLVEVEYGEWTGQELKKLAKQPLWRVVQQHPSAAVFPGGEALAAVQARAVAAVREWDTKMAAENRDAVWLACAHGDVIKAVVADALGMHLDLFQRIMVDPCSVTVITYTETRPFVVRVNDLGSPVDGLLPPKRRRRGTKGRKDEVPPGDAPVGGGSGGAV